MEKRRYSRVAFRLRAFVNSRNVSLKGEVENLSIKGMLLCTDVKLQPGAPVEVAIYLIGTENPLDISVNIRGSVVRTEEHHLVIQFKEMDVDSFSRLKNIIAYNAGNEDKIMEEILKGGS